VSFLNSFAYASGGGHDTYFSSVVGLFHCNNSGLNNGSGPTPLTLAGSAAYSSTQKKFGGFSLNIGASTGSASLSSDAKFSFGTGDFTLEGFAYLSTIVTGQVLMDFRGTEPDTRPLITIGGGAGSGAIAYYNNGSYRIQSGTAYLTANTWFYWALSRNSGTSRLWYGISGTCAQVSSNFTDSINCTGAPLNLGRTWNGLAPIVSGYEDEVRITKGVGRYATAPTVPIVAFENL
jgi:hypothetical protein